MALLTGHVRAVTGPDSVGCTITRAGPLPLTTTWSGAVSGQVARPRIGSLARTAVDRQGGAAEEDQQPRSDVREIADRLCEVVPGRLFGKRLDDPAEDLRDGVGARRRSHPAALFVAVGAPGDILLDEVELLDEVDELRNPDRETRFRCR